MMRSIHDALVEADELETSLMPKRSKSPALVAGSSLLREVTIKPGLHDVALSDFRHGVLRVEIEAGGCGLVLLMNDPSSLDASFLCLWPQQTGATVPPQLETGLESGVRSASAGSPPRPKPNGADGFAALRASRPAHSWDARDAVLATFASRYYDGGASEGFYPTAWRWLMHQPAARVSRRLGSLAAHPGSAHRAENLTQAAAGGGVNVSAAVAAAADGTRSIGSGSHVGLLALEGLAASKTMGVFKPGELGRGVHLLGEILAPQARDIPGAVAAATLHDPALNKLLWVVLWRSERERDVGEGLLNSVLNVSRALAPLLAEPLATERWPEAAVFWKQGGEI